MKKSRKIPTSRVDLKASTRWVVIGGRSETQIFKAAPKSLTLVESLENKEARKKDRDIVSDKPGRAFASAGGGVRHALDNTSKEHEFQAKKSAKAVADFLKKSAKDGRFTELALMAEPHFLGMLRSALGKKLSELVVVEVPKEILAKTDAEMKLKALQELNETEGKAVPARLEAEDASGEAEAAKLDYPLEVTFRDIPPSEALKLLILERAAKMNRHARHIISGHVLVSAPHRKKHQGTVYHVSIHLHLPNKEIVINRDPERDHAHEDAKISIRDAFLAATRQLEDFERVRRGD